MAAAQTIRRVAARYEVVALVLGLFACVVHFSTDARSFRWIRFKIRSMLSA